jgi:HJR/Mrr/RecB family endonuclease
MMFHTTAIKSVGDSIRKWIINQFVLAIQHLTDAADRRAAIEWLENARDTLSSQATTIEKAKTLNASIEYRATAKIVANSVATTVRNYKQSNLPLPVKLAIPATLAAAPFVGGHAAGLAAFGGAIGLPVLLLLFIGAAGVTSIIEGVVKSPETRSQIAAIIAKITEDEFSRRLNAKMKAAMKAEPVAPAFTPVPPEEAELRAFLLAMDPFQFESHVVAFFQNAGLIAWVTRKTNDYGVDGFAKHPKGLIATQCKRYALDNKVGGPAIREFWGSIEASGAFRGYIVTTSSFTPDAISAAALSDKVVLIDGAALVRWHFEPPSFAD